MGIYRDPSILPNGTLGLFVREFNRGFRFFWRAHRLVSDFLCHKVSEEETQLKSPTAPKSPYEFVRGSFYRAAA